MFLFFDVRTLRTLTPLSSPLEFFSAKPVLIHFHTSDKVGLQGKDRGAHFALGGGLKVTENLRGSGGEAPEKFSMTTPSTLAINTTNAPFHRQTHLGKDSYHQHVQSLNHIKKHHLLRCTVLHFIFHSEKTQPNFHNLVGLLSPKNNDMETHSLYCQKQTF